MERELAKIRKAAKQLRVVEGDQNDLQYLRAIESEKLRLKELEEQIRAKERENEQVIMRSEIERDNLKTMHQLIDIQEQKFGGDPYYHQRSRHTPFIGGTGTIVPAKALDLQRLQEYQSQGSDNPQRCSDCGIGMTYRNSSVYGATQQQRPRAHKEQPDFERAEDDEAPIFKINSIVDWLDHRKYHAKVHQEKLQLSQQKMLDRLTNERNTREAREKDWATSKVDRLERLLKTKQLGPLQQQKRVRF